MHFSYVTVAAKTTNLHDLRHSESASNLQQYLHIMYKKKTGILGVGTIIIFITLL